MRTSNWEISSNAPFKDRNIETEFYTKPTET